MTLTKLDRLNLRRIRVRKKVSGTASLPRLNVHRSLKHIYVQAIDDTRGTTIASVSTLSNELRGSLDKLSKTEQAKKVGELIAKKLQEQKIVRVVFDRAGRVYHGRIKALAESVRSTGLQF